VLRVSLDERSAREYRDSYDEFCLSLERHAKRSGAQYLHLSTVQPIESVLFRDLRATRQAIGRQ